MWIFWQFVSVQSYDFDLQLYRPLMIVILSVYKITNSPLKPSILFRNRLLSAVFYPQNFKMPS